METPLRTIEPVVATPRWVRGAYTFLNAIDDHEDKPWFPNSLAVKSGKIQIGYFGGVFFWGIQSKLGGRAIPSSLFTEAVTDWQTKFDESSCFEPSTQFTDEQLYSIQEKSKSEYFWFPMKPTSFTEFDQVKELDLSSIKEQLETLGRSLNLSGSDIEFREVVFVRHPTPYTVFSRRNQTYKIDYMFYLIFVSAKDLSDIVRIFNTFPEIELSSKEKDVKFKCVRAEPYQNLTNIFAFPLEIQSAE